ncbi:MULTISPECIES: hypothetical protein [Aquimarina]|uniref:hypothetical protein n=1 Tax=Aquimarina TaxID=290174 RepID=UPI00131F022F|nr:MULTISPECIES: hypothetical protein [Aquimarina]
MLQNILNLEGVQQLNHEEKKSLKAGDHDEMYGEEYYDCIRTCGGSCSATGRCFEMIK